MRERTTVAVQYGHGLVAVKMPFPFAAEFFLLLAGPLGTAGDVDEQFQLACLALGMRLNAERNLLPLVVDGEKPHPFVADFDMGDDVGGDLDLVEFEDAAVEGSLLPEHAAGLSMIVEPLKPEVAGSCFGAGHVESRIVQ